MTGPVKFNPFVGVSGTESLEQQVTDRRKGLRFPDIDLSPVELSMNQGQDDEAEVALENLDLNMDLNKKNPKE